MRILGKELMSLPCLNGVIIDVSLFTMRNCLPSSIHNALSSSCAASSCTPARTFWSAAVRIVSGIWWASQRAMYFLQDLATRTGCQPAAFIPGQCTQSLYSLTHFRKVTILPPYLERTAVCVLRSFTPSSQRRTM